MPHYLTNKPENNKSIKMKTLKTLLAMALLAVGCMSILTACGDDDNDEPEAPKVSISLRSCSITEGMEYQASTLTEVTLSYNTVVAVSPKANITLNGTKCSAASSATTAMNVIVTLPTLEAGTSYTLDIPAGSIVGKDDATASAPAYQVKFTTKAKPATGDIPTAPVTASAPQAKALYQLLLNYYGEKVVSSVMANVNWNNDCAEKVYKLTGKYPAMNCYDFIHICFSPANWIDYTNIKPVTDWVKAGGLVQLMWHFNVPKKEGSTDVTCTPSETTFKTANVFVDGTWEHKWFYEQMDKVTTTILQLQQAGIAATWRPFHEAAGNATAKQQAAWTKSWFWWGYDGAETYKKLWRTMFDYFKQKGINNLIWVWTTQNYNGNSQQYNQDTDWYPGTEYVDIVARDLYGYSAAQNAQEFNEIQAAYPNKMVALGECGYGDNGGARTEQAFIGDCFTQGAAWSHFMVWYQGGQGSTDTMCSDDWWRNVMKSDYVITRDELPTHE